MKKDVVYQVIHTKKFANHKYETEDCGIFLNNKDFAKNKMKEIYENNSKFFSKNLKISGYKKRTKRKVNSIRVEFTPISDDIFTDVIYEEVMVVSCDVKKKREQGVI